MYFHHAIGLFGILSAMTIGRIVGVIAMCLMVTELSSIFLNLRSIMKEFNLDQDPKYMKCYTINGLVLVFTFFVIRIIF